MPRFLQMLKSKTLWVSMAAIVAGLGTYFAGDGDLQPLLLSIFGLISFMLRFFTDKDLTEK